MTGDAEGVVVEAGGVVVGAADGDCPPTAATTTAMSAKDRRLFRSIEFCWFFMRGRVKSVGEGL